MPEKMKTYTVAINDEVRTAARVIAAHKGMYIREYVEDAVIRAINADVRRTPGLQDMLVAAAADERK